MPRRNETRPVRLELALPENAAMLTVIQARAFHDDVRFIDSDDLDRLLEADDPPQGPPGVTDIEWTRNMIVNANAIYYKILLGNRLVGGVILAKDAEKHANENFWRIFIEPVYHGRGIGQEAFRQVFRLHPTVKRWRLGTPEYATRNRRFYESMGFTLLEIRDDPHTWFRSCDYENTLSPEERLKL